MASYRQLLVARRLLEFQVSEPEATFRRVVQEIATMLGHASWEDTRDFLSAMPGELLPSGGSYGKQLREWLSQGSEENNDGEDRCPYCGHLRADDEDSSTCYGRSVGRDERVRALWIQLSRLYGEMDRDGD